MLTCTRIPSGARIPYGKRRIIPLIDAASSKKELKRGGSGWGKRKVGQVSSPGSNPVFDTTSPEVAAAVSTRRASCSLLARRRRRCTVGSKFTFALIGVPIFSSEEPLRVLSVSSAGPAFSVSNFFSRTVCNVSPASRTNSPEARHAELGGCMPRWLIRERRYTYRRRASTSPLLFCCRLRRRAGQTPSPAADPWPASRASLSRSFFVAGFAAEWGRRFRLALPPANKAERQLGRGPRRPSTFLAV